MHMDKVDPVMNRDLTAAYLSIVPGVGHLYKHQFRKGLAIISLGNIVVGLVTGLLGFATFGAALIIMPILWIGWAAFDAFNAPDLSHRSKASPPAEQPR
jgi:TM2 domain-containing membrane protein YozV